MLVGSCSYCLEQVFRVFVLAHKFSCVGYLRNADERSRCRGSPCPNEKSVVWKCLNDVGFAAEQQGEGCSLHGGRLRCEGDQIETFEMVGLIGGIGKLEVEVSFIGELGLLLLDCLVADGAKDVNNVGLGIGEGCGREVDVGQGGRKEGQQV